MAGGFGNDVYVVDNVGDVVGEVGRRRHRHGAGARSPTRCRRNLENLTLTGAGQHQRHRQHAANMITGNTGNNVLSAGGNDTLNGGDGNDTLNGGAGADT